MFDSDTQGFYKSEQQESSIMRRSFNPHALQRSAPLLHVGAVYHHEFQSTRPMRGATKYQGRVDVVAQFQSTRPMRGATYTDHTFCFVCEFQSTRPMRGTTVVRPPPLASVPSFNPRAPCGARQVVIIQAHEVYEFQSTRPMRGATMSFAFTFAEDEEFQSTRPVWGATQKLQLQGF